MPSRKNGSRASARTRPSDAGFGHAGRLAAVRAEMRRRRLPGLLVTSPLNLRYLSGVSDAAWGLVTAQDASALPYALGAQAARRDAARGWRVLPPAEAWPALRREAARAGVSRLGVEAGALTLDQHERARALLGGAVLLAPVGGVVETARETKDAAELRLISLAARITRDTGSQVPFLLRPGMTERAVAAELDRRMRALGADGPAFETIVLGGPRSALPHGRPGDRPFRPGDLCLVDWGARLDGYHSDCTRVWCVPPATARQRRTYAAVRRAYAAGRRAVAAGRPVAASDRAARAALGQLAPRFIHSLGHGVGLEIHEAPRLHRTAPERFRAGQVVTVEPGVYLPGWGGIRLEDTLVVTPGGHRTLTGEPPAALPLAGASA